MCIVDIEMSDANVGLLDGTSYDKRDKNLDLLNKDRLELLVKNKEEICEKINITTDVLDVIVKNCIITTDDKQIIMVNIPLLFDISHMFTQVFLNL